MLTRRILGAEVIDDHETGRFGSFPAEKVSFVQIWRPKKNYSVPRFHIYGAGNYSSLLTLESCKAALIDYHFLPFGKYLVNARQIKDYTPKGLAKFDSAKEILLPRDKIKYAYQLGQSLKPIPDDLDFIAARYNENWDLESETEFGWFTLKDLCYIDIYEVKSNYKVPRFHTTKGIFTVILTISACQQIFLKFRKMDSGLLVNFDYVDFVKENERGVLEVHFSDRSIVEIAEARRNMISHLIVNDLAF